MGEIRHVHQSEDQCQADREQAIEQPHQEAARQALDDGRGGQKLLPLNVQTLILRSIAQRCVSKDGGRARTCGYPSRRRARGAASQDEVGFSGAYFIGQVASATAACGGKMVTNLPSVY